MERRHEQAAAARPGAAAQPRDRILGVQQRLRREGAERDHHLRLHDVDLPEQERLAAGHFVGLGVAVAGRPALEDVGDVDVLPRVAHRLDDLGEQLAGAADERLALDVFVGARRLADEHQIGARVADAVDDLLPPLRVQLAADAVAEVVADRDQRRGGDSASAGTGSGASSRSAAGRSSGAAGRGAGGAGCDGDGAARPRGIAADAVDAELAVELEMRPDGVADVAHARPPSSGTT